MRWLTAPLNAPGYAPRLRLAVLAGLLLALAFALAGLMLPGSAAAKTRNIIAYKVQPGDTLYDLAEDYFLRPGYAEKVRRINRIRNPRRLPIGKIIYIPKPYLKYDELGAKVQAYRGQVIISRKRPSVQERASKGMALKEGDIISTASAGFVTIAIEGGARTSLPSRSTVRIHRLRRYAINDEIERIFTLHKGRTDVEAGSLNNGKGGKGLEIRGPNATAAIRGTGFSVSAAPEKTGISVLHGLVAASPAAPGPTAEELDHNAAAPLGETHATALKAGLGIIGDETGLSDPIPLLKAPEQADPRPLYTRPEVNIALSPLAGAASYRFRIAADAAMIDVIAEQDSTSPEARFAGLEDGRYFLQVSAIDANGLEGFGRSYAFRRLLAAVDAGTPEQSGKNVKFAWTSTGKGGPARFVLADNPDLANPLVDMPGLYGEEMTLAALPPGTYYWTVERRLVLDGEPVLISAGARELVMAAQ